MTNEDRKKARRRREAEKLLKWWQTRAEELRDTINRTGSSSLRRTLEVVEAKVEHYREVLNNL